MDTVEESFCFQEIPEVMWKIEKVAQVEQFQIPNCIIDNPGFQAVCLNQWVLQAAWSQYHHQYGTGAYKRPENKRGMLLTDSWLGGVEVWLVKL